MPTPTKPKDGFTIPNLTDLILLNFRLPSERNGCPDLGVMSSLVQPGRTGSHESTEVSTGKKYPKDKSVVETRGRQDGGIRHRHI